MQFIRPSVDIKAPSNDFYHAPSQRHRSSRHTKHKTPQEIADEELQRAIQLSLEEANAPMQHGPRRVPASSEPPLVERNARPAQVEEDDPDLKAAIEASLREASAPRPSAPVEEDRAATPRPTQPYMPMPPPNPIQVCVRSSFIYLSV